MENVKKIEMRMEKTVSALVANLAKIRSGRAHAGLLDNITAPCYGADMPLSQLATVSLADNRTLLVSVWDGQNTAAIEKAIRDSDFGVNPATAGANIRVSLPPLSEDRRRELGKLVGKEGEEARIAARNIRRESIAAIKAAVKEKTIGEDEGRRAEQEVDKLTAAAITRIDTAVNDKQQELMTV